MAVKHIRLYGTKEEIEDTVKALPKRATDRLLSASPIYDHMCKHLGIEIQEICISKVELTPHIMDVIRGKAKQYPKMLYRVTDKNNRLFFELEPGEYTNFADVGKDSEFPGPFGQLCKRYGKSYY